MRYRVLALLAAIVAAVLVAPSAASAHSTDDWVKVSNPDLDGWSSRYAESTAGNVDQGTAIYWNSRSDVVVVGGVSDLKADGYCGAIQIRYEIADSSGNWAGHWHYRQLAPAVDCSTDGKYTYSSIWRSRYPTRYLSARACHAGSDGAIIHCESNWH
ncbi:hypothetical protein [Nocardia sp. NRRL S-836]|uniref:hypothetical protein n=1 Tax=Nocardia sp. NRRL S-836 TaxID=1519492 RepID=UPI000AD19179|nr:hypothetical protein [Nocardia sp. NRRL S-836]